MKAVEKIMSRFQKPVLNRNRIWFALGVALITDALQFGLGPFGWLFVDEGLDVVAMFTISWAIGFHMLLLPTFIIEFIPGPDMLPTWTGCTAAVILLRQRAQPDASIDITSEVTSTETAPVTKSSTPSPPPLLRDAVQERVKSTG
jgi:hypothetical protein